MKKKNRKIDVNTLIHKTSVAYPTHQNLLKKHIRILCIMVITMLTFKIPEKALGSHGMADIVINEIAAFETSDYEWIEIFNRGCEKVDMKNWKFYENETKHKLAVQKGTDILNPGEYAIIAKNAEKFIEKYPEIPTNIFDSSWSSLKESGEEIGLMDENNEIQEQFTYIESPDTSLERKNPWENEYGETNWQAHENSGSPGIKNTLFQGKNSCADTNEQSTSDQIPQSPVQNTAIDEDNDAASEEDNEEENTANNKTEQENETKEKDEETAKKEENNEKKTSSKIESSTKDKDSAEDTPSVNESQLLKIEPNNEQEKAEQKNNTTYDENLSKIIINEFLPNPKGSDAQNEWIELKNLSTTDVFLKDAALDDSDNGSSPFIFTNHEIKGNGFLLLKIMETGITLNNTNDSVRLLHPNGSIIDEVLYEKAPEEKSFGRKQDNAFEWTSKLTPEKENEFDIASSENKKMTTSSQKKSRRTSTAQKYQNGDLSDAIIITELLPNPKGSDTENEWIEIFNKSDNEVNLGNWQLDDDEGGSKPYTFSDQIIIKAHEYIVVKRAESKLSLNNTTENIRLFDLEGALKDEVEYENAPEQKSYARIRIMASTSDNMEQWDWTSDISMGEENPQYEILEGDIGDIIENEKTQFTFKIGEISYLITVPPTTLTPELAQTILSKNSKVKIIAKKITENEYELKKIELTEPSVMKEEKSTSSLGKTTKFLLILIPLSGYFFAKMLGKF